MLDITTDLNKYPHRVFASVILLDNKIVNWKTGDCRWSKKNYTSSNQPLIVNVYDDKIVIRSKQSLIVYDNDKNIVVRSRSFIANTRQERNNIFEVKARKFYKQFKLYKGFRLMKPY